MAKNDDVMECYHCGRETKRINHVLEVPSCSKNCDVYLHQEQAMETPE